MEKHETSGVETLLRAHERWCMNACGRFINRVSLKGKVWVLHDGAGDISALIVYARQSLLPVLCDQKSMPSLHFLNGFFGAVPVHSAQGRKDDVMVMETVLEQAGISEPEKNDYDIMCIDRPPAGYHSAGPAGLVIRRPHKNEMDALAALHAAYEREEVIPVSSQFSAAVSRLNTEKLFANEQMLVAELGGRLVGKINTNTVSFTRYQAGGVYVHPDYRGLGIARRMTGEFTSNLIAQGKGVSLFVKKSNSRARHVYQRIGFEISGDYRINYY